MLNNTTQNGLTCPLRRYGTAGNALAREGPLVLRARAHHANECAARPRSPHNPHSHHSPGTPQLHAPSAQHRARSGTGTDPHRPRPTHHPSQRPRAHTDSSQPNTRHHRGGAGHHDAGHAPRPWADTTGQQAQSRGTDAEEDDYGVMKQFDGKQPARTAGGAILPTHVRDHHLYPQPQSVRRTAHDRGHDAHRGHPAVNNDPGVSLSYDPHERLRNTTKSLSGGMGMQAPRGHGARRSFSEGSFVAPATPTGTGTTTHFELDMLDTTAEEDDYGVMKKFDGKQRGPAAGGAVLPTHVRDSFLGDSLHLSGLRGSLAVNEQMAQDLDAQLAMEHRGAAPNQEPALGEHAPFPRLPRAGSTEEEDGYLAVGCAGAESSAGSHRLHHRSTAAVHVHGGRPAPGTPARRHAEAGAIPRRRSPPRGPRQTNHR